MDISFSILLNRPTFLVQSGFPDSDTERVRLVDGLLTIFQRKALGVAEVIVIVIVIAVFITILVSGGTVIRYDTLFGGLRGESLVRLGNFSAGLSIGDITAG